MAQSTGEEESVIEQSTVVDVDVHLRPHQLLEEIPNYLDTEPYHSRLKHSARPPWPLDQWDREMGGKFERKLVGTPQEIRDTLCDEFGIDHPILNSIAFTPMMAQKDYATKLTAAFNDLMLDQYLDGNDDFYGLASVAPQEPAKAAEEIDRMGSEDQICGIFILTSGPRVPLGDPQYDPLYQAAQDNDLPIVYHGTAGTEQDYPLQRYRSFLSVHIIAHMFQQAQTLTSLVVQGTPEKFPDLDFVFVESGVEWVPYMIGRLNKEYSIRRQEAPLLQKSPEEYIRESFYFGTQPIGEPNDPKHLQQLLEIVGPDLMMFGTDYPHWDFDHPDGLTRYLRAFEAADRDAVLNGNAKSVFDLNI